MNKATILTTQSKNIFKDKFLNLYSSSKSHIKCQQMELWNPRIIDFLLLTIHKYIHTLHYLSQLQPEGTGVVLQ